MLGRLICFCVGLFLGVYFSPRIIEQPKPEIYFKESCNQAPITISCPDIKCDNSALKQNLFQWIHFSKDLSEKLSTCYDQREEYLNQIKNEKEETEYYRKKYIDFSCSK